MDKNSLILEIKNDLNSIKKQVEVALAKLTVLESMIELDNKLGVSVAEPVEAPIEELGIRNEELGISVQTSGEPSLLELSRVQPEITSGASNEELGVEEPKPIAEPIETPIAEPAPVAEPVEAPVEKLGVRSEELGVEEPKPVAEPIEDCRDNACIVRNLMSVISLGDKFRFRHDLFSDDNDLFKETIEILNTLENFEKAVDFLDEKFGWDPENATVVYFYDIIKPKF